MICRARSWVLAPDAGGVRPGPLRTVCRRVGEPFLDSFLTLLLDLLLFSEDDVVVSPPFVGSDVITGARSACKGSLLKKDSGRERSRSFVYRGGLVGLR